MLIGGAGEALAAGTLAPSSAAAKADPLIARAARRLIAGMPWAAARTEVFGISLSVSGYRN
ncbi:MAG: hypothetical protein E5W60_01155 [Mesorhizobium sp.]|nr:MAG: hypothetical protein E5W60_01155 [Mesorhizobium sp.]